MAGQCIESYPKTNIFSPHPQALLMLESFNQYPHLCTVCPSNFIVTSRFGDQIFVDVYISHRTYACWMFRPFLRFHHPDDYLVYVINNDVSPSTAVSNFRLQILFSELYYQTQLTRDTHTNDRYADLRRLTSGIRSDKCVVKWFRHCAKVIECTHTNQDNTASYTPMVW
jgi:hypothetical protein